MKVARAHRDEPWVATEAFKNSMARIGPYGVTTSTPGSPDRSAVHAGPAARRSVRVVVRPRPAPRPSSSQGLHFALALLLASCAFTMVCALLGMLAWEFALGALAATGLFAAFVLEPRPAHQRSDQRVAHMPDYALPPELETERRYATGGFG
jgi:hypothetical protein